jgi:hypothetical protein
MGGGQYHARSAVSSGKNPQEARMKIPERGSTFRGKEKVCLCRNTNSGPPTNYTEYDILFSTDPIHTGSSPSSPFQFYIFWMNCNLKTDGAVSSETSVHLCQTTRRHVPGHNNRIYGQDFHSRPVQKRKPSEVR